MTTDLARTWASTTSSTNSGTPSVLAMTSAISSAGGAPSSKCADEIADGSVTERLEFNNRRRAVAAQGADELIGQPRLARPQGTGDGEAVTFAAPRNGLPPGCRVGGVQVVEDEQRALARIRAMWRRTSTVPSRASRPQLCRGEVGSSRPAPPTRAGQPEPLIERRPVGAADAPQPGPQSLGDQAERRGRGDRPGPPPRREPGAAGRQSAASCSRRLLPTPPSPTSSVQRGFAGPGAIYGAQPDVELCFARRPSPSDRAHAWP